jgi:hypothetical protein
VYENERKGRDVLVLSDDKVIGYTIRDSVNGARVVDFEIAYISDGDG